MVLEQNGFKVFVDPFSAQYLSGTIIDYVSSMQGSGFTFKNPNSTAVAAAVAPSRLTPRTAPAIARRLTSPL
jgi:iron-sulfur cluster assembly accessory protein